MPILREWRAEVRRSLKGEYVAYVNATGIAGYRRALGNYPEDDRFLLTRPQTVQHYDSTAP